MSELISKGILLTILSVIMLMQGCATDKMAVKKDISSITGIKVVRHETPKFQARTLAKVHFVVLGGVIGGNIVAEKEGEKTKAYIPDFGLLITKKFTERAGREIKNWPLMIIQEQPVSADYAESNAMIEFQIDQILYAFMIGVRSDSTISLKDSNGDVLWKRSFTYRSSDFNRKKSFAEYEAENYKLLKEEIEFAAETTVSDYIENFKSGK
jgi:hypothetical protein